jgi:hypothetical protein
MRMVVGCRRVQAGTQPLNINIAPSFFNELLITPIVDYVMGEYSYHDEITETYVGSWAGRIHDATLENDVNK